MIGVVLAAVALAGEGNLELGLWHGAAGAGVGLGVGELAGIEGPAMAIAPAVGGAVGLSSLAWAPDVTTGEAMNIESGELLGAVTAGGILLATEQPPEFAIVGATIGALGGGVIGSRIGDTDPDRHALVRSLAMWGFYYADLSYGIAPVRPSTFTPYRYGLGMVGGAALGLIAPGVPTRLQTNLASGVGWVTVGVTAAVTTTLDRTTRTVALGAAPLLTGGAIAAVLLTTNSGPSGADMLVLPQLDPGTGHRGVRLVFRPRRRR